MKELLTVSGLCKYFGNANTEVRAVDHVSFALSAGEIVLITGPSGSGKTTLLSMLGGLLRPTSGSVILDGIDISHLKESELPRIRALKVGFVFQAFNLLDPLTAEENILFPSQLKKQDKLEVHAYCEHLMEKLGLLHRRHSLPRTLSGGEKQRVAIARALINRPPIILADEPTGNLDSQSGQDVMMILHDISRVEGCGVIVVTHDPRVEDIADRILWLEDGALQTRRAEEHTWMKDPVCGMRVDAWRAIYSTNFHDQPFYFCSERCLDKFKRDPGLYIST